MDQARVQQEQITRLEARVEQLARTSAERDADLQALHRAPDSRDAVPDAGGNKRLILSGHASVAFVDGQRRGRFPNSEFRVDDARLYLEAQIRRGTYLFGELILTQRESNDENFHLGEYYVEFENAMGSLVADRLVNLRLGRLAIPFGDEYQVRNPLQNPLISHSVTDFWGVDEGIGVFGEKAAFAYAAAVQNGGVSRLRDLHRDKSVAARITWTPVSHLSVGVSAFRTGKLDRTREPLSEMWIGNAFFRPVGKASTTRTYEAELGQIDVRWSWKTGFAKGAVGRGSYSDDDTSADNRRRFDFFQTELVQDLVGNLYAAARYSSLRADRGYYIPGMGSFSDYFMGETLTHKTNRLGLGMGYRFHPDLILKFEYTLEDSRTIDGAGRPDEDQVAAELSVKF